MRDPRISYEIYNSLHNAYGIYLDFATILFNAETREYGYFVPNHNSMILKFPFQITNLNIIRFLMKLAQSDISEKLHLVVADLVLCGH